MRIWRVGVMVAAAVVGGISSATAQGQMPRYEAGIQVSVLRLSDPASTNTGLGGRFSVNLSQWAALEAEGTFFPQDDITLPQTALFDNFRVRHYRKRTQAFVGARLGYRGDRFGVFAKVRPGLTSLSERNGGDMCEGEVCALVLLVRPEYRTEFAMDLGGILEYYPSSRLVARFELGDTIIRHRSTAPPCWEEGCTSNNVSSKFGIGFRF